MKFWVVATADANVPILPFSAKAEPGADLIKHVTFSMGGVDFRVV